LKPLRFHKFQVNPSVNPPRYSKRLQRSAPEYNTSDLDAQEALRKKSRRIEKQVTTDPSPSSVGLRAAVGLIAELPLLASITDSVSVVDSTDEELSAIAQAIDQREAYLCPWDEEILGLLKAVLQDSTLAELVIMARLPGGPWKR